MVLVLVGLLLVGIVGKQVLFILSSHYIGISQRGIICPCLLFWKMFRFFMAFLIQSTIYLFPQIGFYKLLAESLVVWPLFLELKSQILGFSNFDIDNRKYMDKALMIDFKICFQRSIPQQHPVPRGLVPGPGAHWARQLPVRGPRPAAAACQEHQ